MPAFSFRERFAEPIRTGTKHQTIRAERKDGRIPAKAGDMLYLYCGMRTKGCFKIYVGPLGYVTCTKVQPISIGIKTRPAYQLIYVVVDGEVLDSSEAEQLAKCDGFPDFKTMMQFWEGRLPFNGYIIHWR